MHERLRFGSSNINIKLSVVDSHVGDRLELMVFYVQEVLILGTALHSHLLDACFFQVFILSHSRLGLFRSISPSFVSFSLVVVG